MTSSAHARPDPLSPRSTPARPLWVPGQPVSVLLVTASVSLQGEVARVGAAAAVELIAIEAVERWPARADGIAVVLVGSDIDEALPGWRGPTVVVGPEPDAGRMWRQAARLGADRVAVLPESAPWLASYLARLREPVTGPGLLGIVGGCGGAGASTLAVLVAAGAAARGQSVLLIDGDPWGGGIDTALGLTEVPGLRWPDLLHTAGPLNPEQLAAALPRTAGCAVLSWPAGPDADDGARRGAAPGTAPAEVVRAARAGFACVVVDLARTPESLARWGAACDALAVVVPARPRAVTAAAALVPRLPAAAVGLVVRAPLGEGADAALLAAAVGVPPVGVLPLLRGVGEGLRERRVREFSRRRRVRRLTAELLAWLEVRGAQAAPPLRERP